MMAWSAKPGQAYLSKEGIRQIKSELANDIFKQELLRLYEQKSVSRDELVHEARKAMLELVQVMKAGICDHPDAGTAHAGTGDAAERSGARSPMDISQSHRRNWWIGSWMRWNGSPVCGTATTSGWSSGQSGWILSR